MPSGYRGRVLARDQGEALWFLGALVTLKARYEDTGGRFSLVEMLAPAGFTAPRRVHPSDDVILYVLEGVGTFSCGDDSWECKPGATLVLPGGVGHGFTVGAEPMRLLQITAPAERFEHLLLDLSEPAPRMTLPPEAEIDLEEVSAMFARHGVEIVD